MAKKSVYSSAGQPVQVEFNMTPMIDVTFQLILFFILVGQVASDALARMLVPEPWDSQAHPPEVIQKQPNKMIINIVSASKYDEDRGSRGDPDGRRVGFYQVDSTNVGKGPEGLMKMENLITKRLAKLPADQKKSFFVEIRADKRLPFAAVYPVLEIAGLKGVPLMNITAIRDLGTGG